MFYRFGIDVRKTDEEEIETLLQNYFGRSGPVFNLTADNYEEYPN